MKTSRLDRWFLNIFDSLIVLINFFHWKSTTILFFQVPWFFPQIVQVSWRGFTLLFFIWRRCHTLNLPHFTRQTWLFYFSHFTFNIDNFFFLEMEIVGGNFVLIFDQRISKKHLKLVFRHGNNFSNTLMDTRKGF